MSITDSIQNLTKRFGKLLSDKSDDDPKDDKKASSVEPSAEQQSQPTEEPQVKPAEEQQAVPSLETQGNNDNESQKIPVNDQQANPLQNLQSKKKSNNPVNDRKKIKESILKLLDSFFLTSPQVCKTKRLILWFDTDKTTFSSYLANQQELEEYLSIEKGYEFKDVELKLGKPENENDARKVNVDLDSIVVYLQIIDQNDIVQTSVAKKARIEVFGNKGKLAKDHYELSSEELKERNRHYYNIGRSEFPDLGSGNYRQNHIVIDESWDSELNKYVSRAHARIGYSESIGFFLQVEVGGSRLYGNRTRIIREEQMIEMENTAVKEPLKNGDLIELGKAVVLSFTEIENDNENQ